jgi:SAM-dependent methyltransferase
MPVQVHQSSLQTIDHYLSTEGQRPVEAYEVAYRKFVRLASRFHRLGRGTRILEVGIGTGAFLVLCAQNGFECVGLDISPQLIEFAGRRARERGVRLDLRLGNIEDARLEAAAFDVVIADSVFEHVEDWRAGVARVATALRPGGVFIFSSTNRFSPRSGEFWLPFYGWLPNGIRYWLRRTLEGPDVMRLGIDFHQFTYRTLRRALRGAGFSRVYDVADLLDPERLNQRAWWKVALLRGMQRSRTMRHTMLTFWPSTELVAVK